MSLCSANKALCRKQPYKRKVRFLYFLFTFCILQLNSSFCFSTIEANKRITLSNLVNANCTLF